MKAPLESDRKDALDQMLDHYFVKLLPWEPGHPSTRILFENEKFFDVEAFFRQDNAGVAEDAGIVMGFTFYKDGKTQFDGVHY